MKKLLLILLPLFLLSLGVAQEKGKREREHRPGNMMEQLKLTDAQKEQFQKNRFDTEKKNIEVRAKLETAHLELRKLLSADAPDIAAVEKKIGEISDIRTTLEINRFETWAANNKLLTPEQQKIWKKALLKRTMERFMDSRNRMRTGKFRSENFPQPGGDRMNNHPMDDDAPMMEISD
jgi:Spy/CpxP family protein refolding chaperone